MLILITVTVTCNNRINSDVIVARQFHQPRFLATVSCCSPYQAASTRIHDTNSLVDICSVFQGMQFYFYSRTCFRWLIYKDSGINVRYLENRLRHYLLKGGLLKLTPIELLFSFIVEISSTVFNDLKFQYEDLSYCFNYFLLCLFITCL